MKNSLEWRANGVRGALVSLDQLRYELSQLHPSDVQEIVRQSELPMTLTHKRLTQLIKAARKVERDLRRKMQADPHAKHSGKDGA